MDSKKAFRLICVVLVQIAVLDIILGVLVIKKAGSNKVGKINTLTHSSAAVPEKTDYTEADTKVQIHKFGSKSIQDQITSLLYKKPVIYNYSNPDLSGSFPSPSKSILSLIYSEPLIPYTQNLQTKEEIIHNINQKYLSLIYRKPLFDISDTGDIKLAADEPLLQDYTATAYDLSYESCGKYPGHHEYGITFSGKKAVKGRTVAVDPKYIPLGSLVYIKFPKPYLSMTGWYTAEDTGSKIKGKIIDVYLGESALKEARNFGRREVEIMVVNAQ